MARTLLEPDRVTRAQFLDVLGALARPELGDRVLGAGPVALEAVAAGQRQYTAPFSSARAAAPPGAAALNVGVRLRPLLDASIVVQLVERWPGPSSAA